MEQHPVAISSSKAYQPTEQRKKSLVFSSFVNVISKQAELMKLTNMRDIFFQNHISVSHEKVKNFVIDCTNKASKPEDGKAIACAFLTLRDQNFIPLYFEYVFIQKSSEFSNIIEVIWSTINDNVRKSYHYFSPNASQNTLNLLTCVCEKNQYFNKIGDLTNFLISSIDAGCITQINLNLIEYFASHTRKFFQIWAKLDHVIVNLIIKFLRFYQDTYLIKLTNAQEEPVESTKLTSVQGGTVPLRSISASTSSIPTLNSSGSRTNVLFFQKALNLATSYENYFPTFFNLGITTNTIAKCAFKEIDRILYDSRTYQHMNKKFPSIYKSLNMIHESFISCYTQNTILQVMLPYPHLKEMLLYNNSLNQKTEIDFPPFMKRATKLVDYDLVLSDSIRTYLQSIDYDRTSDDHRTSFICSALHHAIDKNVKLNSTLHALVSDFLFIPADLNENEESQNRICHLINPTLTIIMDPKFEKLASALIEMILYRLKQPDFVTTKTNSFRNLLRYITEKREINIVDHVMTFQHLKENEKEEFRNFASLQEINIIPQQVLEFSRKNLPIDSMNGMAAVQAANERILSFYSQNNNNWELALPNIKKVFDALVSSSRKGIEIILKNINIHASTPCMSYNFFDAQTLLKFVNDEKLYEDFDEALQYTEMKFYCEVLVQEISSNEVSNYKQFLIQCKSFRKSIDVLKNICDYCKVSLVTELADLPYLEVSHEMQSNFIGRILSICSVWSNDSLSKLAILLNGFISTPQELNELSDVIVKLFEQLPSIIICFLQNLMMTRVDPLYAQLMNKISQSKTQKAIEFYKNIMNKWNTKKALNPQSSRPSLVPDMMI